MVRCGSDEEFVGKREVVVEKYWKVERFIEKTETKVGLSCDSKATVTGKQ